MADKNYISYADTDSVNENYRVYPDITIVDPLQYSDIVKLSHASNVVIRNCQIHGGIEDCVDMNRYCENVLIENCTVYPHGKYGFTIKGGSKNITLRNIIFDGHGSEVDIDLGNWSDQSMEQSTNITLENVASASGKPVKVRVLWAEKPKVIGGYVSVLTIPKLFVWIYRWFRARKLVP